MKYCKYCDRDLPLESFSRRAASPDGLGYKCRECSSAYVKKRWAEDEAFRLKATEKAIAWGKVNRERRREIVKRYDDKHVAEKRVRAREKWQQYRKDNPKEAKLKGRIARQIWMHRVRAIDGIPHPGVITRLLQKANGRCTYCRGFFENLTLDHFHPISKGGDGSVWNLIPCCKHCNSSKRDKDGCTWIERKFGIQRLIEVYWRMEELSAARLP